jgi:hypothetical protein
MVIIKKRIIFSLLLFSFTLPSMLSGGYYTSPRYGLPVPQIGAIFNEDEERRLVDTLDQLLFSIVKMLTPDGKGCGIVEEGIYVGTFVSGDSKVTLFPTRENPAIFAFVNFVPIYTRENIEWESLQNNSGYYLYLEYSELGRFTPIASLSPKDPSDTMSILIAHAIVTSSSVSVEKKPPSKKYIHYPSEYDLSKKIQQKNTDDISQSSEKSKVVIKVIDNFGKSVVGVEIKGFGKTDEQGIVEKDFFFEGASSKTEEIIVMSKNGRYRFSPPYQKITLVKGLEIVEIPIYAVKLLSISGKIFDETGNLVKHPIKIEVMDMYNEQVKTFETESGVFNTGNIFFQGTYSVKAKSEKLEFIPPYKEINLNDDTEVKFHTNIK